MDVINPTKRRMTNTGSRIIVSEENTTLYGVYVKVIIISKCTRCGYTNNNAQDYYLCRGTGSTICTMCYVEEIFNL